MLEKITVAPAAIQTTQHQLFRSKDLDEARVRVGEVYCDHYLGLNKGSFEAFHYHIPFDGISFNYMGYGAECLIEPGCLGDFYLLQLPIKGNAEIICDGEKIESYPGKASILNPHSYTKMVWSEGCEQLLVQIDKDRINKSFVNSFGRALEKDIEFNPEIGSGDEKHAAWWRHVVSFIKEFNQKHSFYKTSCILNNELDNIVTSLLYSLDHNMLDTLTNDSHTVLPKHIHAATEYIRCNYSENIGIHDLVEITGVSERCIFEGFRKSLDITPMQFLMQTRLTHVREELLESATPINTNITKIAMDNGFTQLGRFSSYYKSMYGELPSETMKSKKTFS